jgi:hypothetical protein
MDSEPTIDAPVPWLGGGDEDAEDTLSGPAFARYLARSVVDEIEARTVTPADSGSTTAASAEIPCVVTVSEAPAKKTRVWRSAGLVDAAAFVVVAALLFTPRWVSGSASEVARESAALARAAVGCPALQTAFVRAPHRTPSMTVKQSSRETAATRATHHAHQRATPPRPGLIRVTPF